MPEFILNDNARNWLRDDFTQGYVEAMFFTNDTGDLGTARLTLVSRAMTERDCARFQTSHNTLLQAAYALEPGADNFRYAREPLDARRAGQLLWYARQGYGATWTDDGSALCLAQLQTFSRAFSECIVEVYRGWIHVL